MTKVYNWVENNAIKTLIVTTILVTFIFGTAYVLSIKNDVRELQKQCLIKSRLVQDNVKPEYNTLKSHTVFIIGCSGDIDASEKLSNFPIGEDGMCWSGTAVVAKVTDDETYLLSNNHVFGKGTDNPIIYVENGESKVQLELVAYHQYADVAVMKMKGKLEGKTPLTKISSVSIQDEVFVVGHPLGVKYVYTTGYMAGYEGISMLLQLPCIYGSSGSGIWDKDGNLVGLVFALETYKGFAGIPEARITHILAVDSITIKFFLKDLGLYND
jgi:Trypsin-like peptidase domain